MHLASENRAVARLVDAAQFLHDRRRQPDLEAGDGAAAARDTDRLEFLPDRIGLIEIGRRELGRQDVDLLPLAEQPGDALGFLLDVQIYAPADFHHGDTEVTENNNICRAGFRRDCDWLFPLLRALRVSVVFSPSLAAQFAADDLAGRGQGQLVDEHDLAPRLVPGEAL